jgi:hypothetical protein
MAYPLAFAPTTAPASARYTRGLPHRTRPGRVMTRVCLVGATDIARSGDTVGGSIVLLTIYIAGWCGAEADWLTTPPILCV